MITNYHMAPNVTSDTEIAKERLPEIKSNFDATDMYADGGFSGSDVEQVAESAEIKVHYTDMKGKENDKRIPVNKFEYNEDKTVKACPEDCEPTDTSYHVENDAISAHLPKETCEGCELKEKCRVKDQKKACKFCTTGEAVEKQNKRDEVKEENRTRARGLP